MIIEKIKAGRIIPVIALDDANDAAPLCAALREGGLEVAEITFRTEAARAAIGVVAREFPHFLLGAGTVTRLEELEAAKEAGAAFAVAPGLNPIIVKRAGEIGLPFFPGVATPSDIEAALDLDCHVVKFFPAGALGGVKMIKALHAPYRHRDVSFIPTGGVNADNLSDYLACPGVIAVGGSWIVEKRLIADQDWQQVTALTKAATKKTKD